MTTANTPIGVRRALLAAAGLLLASIPGNSLQLPAAGDTSAGLPPAIADGRHPVTGRRIAPVMSHAGADWLDREERAAEEAPDRALDAIGIAPGARVADLGAGSGYFTVRLARRVGPAGHVYATDVQPEMLMLLRERLKRERIRNVSLVHGTPEDPRLPLRGVDLVLMVDVYHELAQPQRMLRRLRGVFRPGGRLVLLEYRKEDPDVPIRPDHKMSIAEAKAELEADGYRLVQAIGVLPRQHILIFTPE